MNKEAIKMLNQNLKDPSIVFLIGGAGVGKSTLVKSLFETSDKNIIKYANTVVAALLIGGTTIESGLQIPPNVSNPLIEITKILKPTKREALTILDRFLNPTVIHPDPFKINS